MAAGGSTFALGPARRCRRRGQHRGEFGLGRVEFALALRAMEALGYVALQQRPDNRKNNYVFLTPRGKRLKKLLVPLAEEVNALALHGLPDADVATTRHALLTMIDNLARDAT